MNFTEAEKIQNILEYVFENTALLEQAFMLPGYAAENGRAGGEQLANVGQEAINFVITCKIVEHYGKYEGESIVLPNTDLGKIREKLAGAKALASRVEVYGLDRFIMSAKGDANLFKDVEKLYAGLYRSLIGAVAIDCGYNTSVLADVVEALSDISFYLENNFNGGENFADLILRWSRCVSGNPPEYSIYKEDENSDVYVCYLALPNVEDDFYGEGYTKSSARMSAAEDAYYYLEDNGIFATAKSDIAEPTAKIAVHELFELYRKGFIERPLFSYEEIKGGEKHLFKCTCSVGGGYNISFSETCDSKSGAQRGAAYAALLYILGHDPDY